MSPPGAVEPHASPLELRARIAAWDASQAAVREFFRREGVLEVSTPVRLAAVAIEPFIEPFALAQGVLATSPELPMKTLLMGGAGPIFQIAHVLRAAEQGAQHAEEFHLIEWYRPGATDIAALQRDTEQLVDAVFGAIGIREAPRQWRSHGMLDLVHRTTGVTLSGDEDARALQALFSAEHPDWIPDAPTHAESDVARLLAWTSFFSSWCDAALDPWLAQQVDGIHVTEFPPALAALAEVAPPRMTQVRTRGVAFRVESYVGGVELSNGYRELTCAAEQRRRFTVVQGLRTALGEAPLPMPEAFLAAMQTSPLPPTVGCALGLDRLLALACDRERIRDVALPLSWTLPRPHSEPV